MRRDKAVKAGANSNQRAVPTRRGRDRIVIPYAGQNRHRVVRTGYHAATVPPRCADIARGMVADTCPVMVRIRGRDGETKWYASNVIKGGASGGRVSESERDYMRVEEEIDRDGGMQRVDSVMR